MKKIIIFFGMPKSGKKTHSKMLSEKLGYKYFNVENVIVNEISNKTKMGLIFEKYQNGGIAIPDEYFILLMRDLIINLKEDGVVFCGFPKNIAQAKALDFFLFNKNIKSPVSIFLKAELTVLFGRCGEQGQNFFRNQMNEYERKTKPLLFYYSSKMFEFDTSKDDVNQVNKEILKHCFDNID